MLKTNLIHSQIHLTEEDNSGQQMNDHKMPFQLLEILIHKSISRGNKRLIHRVSNELE